MALALSMRRAVLRCPGAARIGIRGLAASPISAPELRRPFQQKDRRRYDSLQPRMLPSVPDVGLSVQAWISDWSAPRTGITLLRSDVWTMPLRTDIIHRVVTWQRACMRQGTSKTKGRHEVRGGGRKPRPQKGSGRSRQGSIRSPLYVGGGHAHPKRPRDFSYKLALKVQSLGLKTALSDKYRRGAMIVMRDLDFAGHLTANPRALATDMCVKLGALGVDLRKQRVMIVASATAPNNHLEGVALDGVLVRTAAEVSVLDVVKHTILLVSLDSLTELEQRFVDNREQENSRTT